MNKKLAGEKKKRNWYFGAAAGTNILLCYCISYSKQIVTDIHDSPCNIHFTHSPLPPLKGKPDFIQVSVSISPTGGF